MCETQTTCNVAAMWIEKKECYAHGGPWPHGGYGVEKILEAPEGPTSVIRRADLREGRDHGGDERTAKDAGVGNAEGQTEK